MLYLPEDVRVDADRYPAVTNSFVAVMWQVAGSERKAPTPGSAATANNRRHRRVRLTGGVSVDFGARLDERNNAVLGGSCGRPARRSVGQFGAGAADRFDVG
jgi:hypothetical protein